MASLKIIRTRIVSVKNTQKITKAMKMVAAAKLRRAQRQLTQSRQYGAVLEGLIHRLLAGGQDLTHPFLEKREKAENAVFLVFTSDRGLCGGFNSNLLRMTDRFLRENKENFSNIKLRVIGRKGCDYFRARGRTMDQAMPGITETFDYERAKALSEDLGQGFATGQWDKVFIAYNRFKSAINQEAFVKQILPIASQTEEGDLEEPAGSIIWEPNKEELLSELLPRYLAMELFLANLESRASELGARMTAMESATNNAAEMISILTLQMNRARQAAITTELMDIVNGVEAMK